MDGINDGVMPEVEAEDGVSADIESRIRKMIGNEEPEVDTMLALAESAADKGDDAEAIRVLQSVIFRDSSCLRAYDRLVDLLIRLGRGREAADTYRGWGVELARARKPSGETDQASVEESSTPDYVAQYYAIRAPEYDQTSSYQKASNSGFIERIKDELRATVRDRDALEIACGTGFWTTVASEAARSLVATDRNVELVEVVKKRIGDAPHVTCRTADAYSLDGVEGPFTAAYAQFWWSHIPRSMIATFLTALHSRLEPGAQVYFMDSLPYRMRETRRLDEQGNVLEPRVLMNGEKYEVIKNFPTEAEIREALAGFADDVEYRAYEPGAVWTVTYKARRPVEQATSQAA